MDDADIQESEQGKYRVALVSLSLFWLKVKVPVSVVNFVAFLEPSEVDSSCFVMGP